MGQMIKIALSESRVILTKDANDEKTLGHKRQTQNYTH